MEAILVNIKTGAKRLVALTIEEYYDFGSNTEKLTPGHAVLFQTEAEKVLKKLCWETIYAIPRDYPKTDMGVCDAEIQKRAKKEALLLLRNKIDNLLDCQ